MKKIAILTPVDEHDGIADYSRHLYASLESEVDIIPLKRNFATFRGLAGRRNARDYFQSLAEECNHYQLVHIQHEYTFFGQLSPLYNYHRWFFAQLKVPYIITVHEVPPAPVQILRHPRSSLKRLLVWPLNTLLDLLFGAFRTERFLNYGLMTGAAVVYVHDASQVETLARREISATLLPMGLVNSHAPIRTIKSSINLGCYGFISSRKGYDIAIKALNLLPDRYQLTIVGGLQQIGGQTRTEDAAYLAELENLIKINAISDQVMITGYLPEEKALAAIAEFDIGLAPFASMSGSASIATMLGYSKPVVIADLPQIRSLVAEGAAVTSFRPYTAEALAKKIEELAANNAAEELAKRGRKYVESHDYTVIAQLLFQQYLKILGDK